ncbi:MAG: hypothetical protein ABWX93_09780 [Pseudoxanthomonas sp.]
MKRMAVAFIGLLCAGSAVGQTAEALDLRVPEPPLYAAAGPASGDPPGTYYGDTTGRPSRRDDARDFTEDDRKARVWGSVTTGIGHSEGYGTSHYNAAEVNVSKPFGDGERPSNLNLQIRVEQSDGPGFGDRTLYPRYRSDPYFPPR